MTTILADCRCCGSPVSGFGGKGDKREGVTLSEPAPAGGSSPSPSSPSSGRGRPFQRTRRKKTKNAGRRWRQTGPVDMERGPSMEGEMRCRGHNHHPPERWPPLEREQKKAGSKTSTS